MMLFLIGLVVGLLSFPAIIVLWFKYTGLGFIVGFWRGMTNALMKRGFCIDCGKFHPQVIEFSINRETDTHVN